MAVYTNESNSAVMGLFAVGDSTDCQIVVFYICLYRNKAVSGNVIWQLPASMSLFVEEFQDFCCC